jgi:phage-related minor tail protein
MKRSVVVLGMLGMIVAVTAGRFAAQEARPEQRIEERLDRLEADTKRLTADTERLASALKRSEATVATLAKEVKTIEEAQERLARAVSVDPAGTVRIMGNLRLDNNVIEDIRVIDCDAEGISGGKRQCTCPTGLITVGIELKPLSVSAYPGPSTYNTALVCGRI